MATQKGSNTDLSVSNSGGHPAVHSGRRLLFFVSVYYVATLNNEVLFDVGAATVVAAVVVLIRVGQHYQWTGFGESVQPKSDNQEIQPRKTLWDWLQLLIVPLALAAIGLWFTTQQDARQQWIEDQRAQSERELEEKRAQDAAVQAYLDQMTQLILDRKLLEAEEGDAVYTLAQARTSTAIARLDAEHNESVARFLTDSGLAKIEDSPITLLKGIGLQRARPSDARLEQIDLTGADLSRTYLSEALGVTNEELEQQARALEGATMPNGQKYEEWLKSKDSGEDGENAGSS